MYQGQGSSEVKLGGKCKIVLFFFFFFFFFFFEELEVQFQPNLIWMQHVNLLLAG